MINLLNSTQIPNEIINGYLPTLSEADLKVLIIVARQTLGWIADPVTGMRKEEDSISFQDLMKKTGLSQWGITKALKKLTEKDLIQVRDEDGKILDTPDKRRTAGRCRKKIFYRLKLKNSTTKDSLVHYQGKQGSTTKDSLVVKTNTTNTTIQKENIINTKKENIIIQKKKKNVIKRKRKFSSIKDISVNDIQDISERYKVPLAFVKLQLEKLHNYCESKGRIYKNYKAALRNFVISEAERKIEKGGRDQNKRGIDASNV